ncbi:MAG: aminoacyl-tRNA hydrolase [Clostridia bacterium]|jgi:PTH1 family peptidyl-tRNA hydrolase|nr:aminoacyl-tRNA hydrolase [Clostridia bacterium]
MFLIIGLGNPGQKYKDTRHNVGFKVIDKIAQNLNIEVDKKEHQGLVQSTFWHGEKILLVKPQTYMNLSGQTVGELINYYHDQIDDLLVIHDDLDLPVGQLRFKKDGGTGGHNGLKSIVEHLNSQDFNRLKIGIGHPQGSMDVKNYVLTSFSEEERQSLEETIDRATEAVKTWMLEGIDKAMNEFNRKRG